MLNIVDTLSGSRENRIIETNCKLYFLSVYKIVNILKINMI